MSVLPPDCAAFSAEVEVAVVGGGACGMTAALAVRDGGGEALVLERNPVPAGSTAMSSGMIPACGTRFQREKGIADDVATMVADIRRKNGGTADPAVVETVCRISGMTIEWLADRHGVPFALVEGFLYPGHSHPRMHAPPDKTGGSLIGALTRAAEAAGADVMSDATVSDLFTETDGRVVGLRVSRPDGSHEDIACRAVILACCGFAGNRDMVRRYIPEMAEAEFHGHVGNKGDAVVWGEALGAAVRHMSGYQGHGSLAVPQRTLITWALMMQGGIQVNADGLRFANEHQGYSEQAVAVIAQPGSIAWDVFDDRLLELGRTFEDFRAAESAGALRHGADAGELARAIGVPPDALATTLNRCAACARGDDSDPLRRDFTGAPPLEPPFHAVRVTGALFHTQGGLVVDTKARVLRPDGTALPNLFAGGGAACGLSGPHVQGYLSGNGLLSAVMLGRLAGMTAAG